MVGLWGRVPAGAVLGLLAAVSWGGGDFSGGMGVKAAGGTTRGALRVVISAHAMSLLVMGLILGWRGGLELRGCGDLVGIGVWRGGGAVVVGVLHGAGAGDDGGCRPR